MAICQLWGRKKEGGKVQGQSIRPFCLLSFLLFFSPVCHIITVREKKTTLLFSGFVHKCYLPLLKSDLYLLFTFTQAALIRLFLFYYYLSNVVNPWKRRRKRRQNANHHQMLLLLKCYWSLPGNGQIFLSTLDCCHYHYHFLPGDTFKYFFWKEHFCQRLLDI